MDDPGNVAHCHLMLTRAAPSPLSHFLLPDADVVQRFDAFPKDLGEARWDILLVLSE